MWKRAKLNCLNDYGPPYIMVGCLGITAIGISMALNYDSLGMYAFYFLASFIMSVP